MINFLETELEQALAKLKTNMTPKTESWWKGYGTAIDIVLTELRRDNVEKYENSKDGETK